MLPLCLSPDLKAFKVISHFLVFGESLMAKKKKKTKRKLAHPKLPMQRHLNLRHEGAPFGSWRLRGPFRRRGRRRYVLFDEVPKRCREKEGDQLRAPVVQNQALHIYCATKFPRFVDGTFRV